MKVSRKIQGESMWRSRKRILFRATPKWELGGPQDASIAGTEPTGSLTRARSRHPLIQADRWIPFPARSLFLRAIPRGKIDPFPGFPTGSAGSYITDGHLYISNSALRPTSFESSIARLFDLPGVQICWLRTSHRLNDCYVRTLWLGVCRLSWEHFRKEKKKRETRHVLHSTVAKCKFR